MGSTISETEMVCRVPLQYLNNTAHWEDIVLAVGPGVLIPRPETRCLLEFAIEVCLSEQMHPNSRAANAGL